MWGSSGWTCRALLAEKHSRDGLVVRMALEVGKHCDEVEQPEGQVRHTYMHTY